MQKNKLHIILSWILFLLIDCFVAGAVAEIWVRGFIPVQNICWQIDDRIGARYCPDQKTYGYVEKGYANVFMTNSMGFHDIERNKRKEEGTFRIQIYGDSMVGGTQVPTDETINAVVERYLNSRGLPYRVEVQNMAAGDESTSSEIMTYEKIGKDFQPDLVVCYFMNDFPENVLTTHGKYHIPYHKIAPGGELQYIPPVPKSTTTLWEKFKKASWLYRLVANKILTSKAYHHVRELQNSLKFAIVRLRDPNHQEDQSYEEVYRTTMFDVCWPLTLRLVAHFKKIAEGDGARFVLADGMEFNSATVGSRFSNKDFESLLREKGVNYIPLYPLDSEMRRPENYAKYVFRDNHLKAVGNERIGVELGRRLLEYLP